MAEEHSACAPGSDKDGDEYVSNGYVYQRYWCVFGDSVSIAVVVRPATDDD